MICHLITRNEIIDESSKWFTNDNKNINGGLKDSM